MGNNKATGYSVKYVIYTYGLFWFLIAILGGIATVLLHGTPPVMKWLIAITAWTPTYVFLLMFGKLYPNSSLKTFYKNVFIKKLNKSLLVTSTILQTLIIIISVYIVSVQRGVSSVSLLDFSFPAMISGLFFTMIQGPAGEETGWRGFLLPEAEKKFGVVKGSLLVSIIWAFWHAPVWFLGTGYNGMILIKYIIAFVICIVSLGLIIGICFHQCKNLFIPIWMHFMLNFSTVIFTGSLADLIIWFAVFYFIMAAGYLFWYKVTADVTAIRIARPNINKT